MKIDLIAGARPNFVKIASLIHAQKTTSSFKFRLVHTGQHYTHKLSGSFFDDLELPLPDVNLEVGSGTQAEQTAHIMMRYENEIKKNKPDLCIVVGDVTSSMACAITAKKMNIKLAHIEAGIRSGDLSMPEEINRILIDGISDLLFTTTQNATGYLLKNGKKSEQVYFVGNTMIDTLLRFKSKFRMPHVWKKLNLSAGAYFVLTLHRPSNVDDPEKLKNLLNTVLENSPDMPVIFPVHPRLFKTLEKISLNHRNLYVTEALSYLEFNYLVINSKAVITDSGGVTEETTVLNIPCLTLRENTERPETITIGTNELVGADKTKIKDAMERIINDKWKKGEVPEYWDGKAGNRIIDILKKLEV